MDKYNFKCPACGAVMSVDAENDNDAVNKLMAKGGEHMKEAHPGIPMDPNMDKMVREQMVRGEMEQGEHKM